MEVAREREDTMAYVFIKAELGEATTVAEQVSMLDGVLWADVITGPYDVIAAVKVPGNRELGDLVIGGIHKVPGVRNPLTAVVSRRCQDNRKVLPEGHAWYP